MKIHKKIINCFLCLTLLLLSSCVTKYLWGSKKYDEEILQVYVGSDGRYVVFVSKDHHYIFTDNSGLLKEILDLKSQDVLTMNMAKTYFKLESNNDVNGFIVIEGPFGVLDNEDMVRLGIAGVRPNRDDNVSIKINLSGRRYAARYLGTQFRSSPIIRTIPIYYDGDSNLAKSVGKVAVTPIAVTLDAALLIGKVVISPFKLSYWHD